MSIEPIKFSLLHKVEALDISQVDKKPAVDGANDAGSTQPESVDEDPVLETPQDASSNAAKSINKADNNSFLDKLKALLEQYGITPKDSSQTENKAENMGSSTASKELPFESREDAIASVVNDGVPENIVEEFYDVVVDKDGNYTIELKDGVSLDKDIDIYTDDVFAAKDDGTQEKIEQQHERVTYTYTKDDGSSVRVVANDGNYMSAAYFDSNGNRISPNEAFQEKPEHATMLMPFESREDAVKYLVNQGIPENLVEEFYDIHVDKNGEYTYELKDGVSLDKDIKIFKGMGGTVSLGDTTNSTAGLVTSKYGTYTFTREDGSSVVVKTQDGDYLSSAEFDSNGEKIGSDSTAVQAQNNHQSKLRPFESREDAINYLVNDGIPENLVEEFYDINVNENGEYSFELKDGVDLDRDIERYTTTGYSENADGITEKIEQEHQRDIYTFTQEDGSSVRITSENGLNVKTEYFDESGEKIPNPDHFNTDDIDRTSIEGYSDGNVSSQEEAGELLNSQSLKDQLRAKFDAYRELLGAESSDKLFEQKYQDVMNSVLNAYSTVTGYTSEELVDAFLAEFTRSMA